MTNGSRRGRVLKRLVILVGVCAVLAGGGYAAYKHRLRSAARAALGTGKAAHAAGQYTPAATDLGRYLTVDQQNGEVLLLYADAQLRRRPQSKGSLQQAIGALETALRQQPGHREAAERLLDIYAAIDSRVEAERIARAWATAAKDARDRADARARLVAVLIDGRKFAEADQALQAWEAEARDDPAALRARAGLLVADRPADGALPPEKADQAAKLLQSAVERGPADVQSAVLLASVLLDLKGDRAGAEQVLDALVARNPQSAQAHLARGRFYVLALLTQPYPAAAAQSQPATAVAAGAATRPASTLAGDRDRAVRDFDQAVALGSADPDLLVNAALHYAALGLPDKAAAAFEGAEKAAPGNAGIYTLHGRAVLDEGDTVAAAALAGRVLAAPLGEARLDALPMVAELYATAGRFPEARKALADLQAATPPPEVVAYLNAVILLNDDKLAEGIARLQDAVRRDPKYARAQLLLGRARVLAREPQRALAPLQACADLKRAAAASDRLSQAERPRYLAASARAHLELAQLYAQLGRWDEAVKAVDEARARILDPRLAGRVFLVATELEAQAARRRPDQAGMARLGELRQRLERALQSGPDNLTLALLRARVVGWQGRVDEAAALLDALKAEGDDRQAVALARVELYADARQFDRAVAACRAAVESAGELDRPGLHARLAELLASAGDPAAARRELDALAAGAAGPAKSAARVQLARMLWTQAYEEGRSRQGAATRPASADQLQPVRDLLLGVCTDDPQNLAARLMLLDLLPADARGPSRQDLLDQVRTIEGPDGLNARYWQAVIWLEGGEFDRRRGEIESLLAACLREDPNWDAAVIALGRFHEQARDRNRALALYRDFLVLHPDSIPVARRFLALAQAAGQWEEIDRVLGRLPDDASLRPYRFAGVVRRGRPGLTLDALKSFLDADPRDPTALRGLVAAVDLSVSPEDIASVERFLAQVLRVAPDSPDVLAARVLLHQKKKEFAQALELCDQSLAKSPTAEVLQLRARVCEAKGDLDRAAADLRSLAAVENRAEQGYLALGRLYFRHDRVDQAIACWREGLKAVPGSYVLAGALAGALLGRAEPGNQEEGARIVEGLLAGNLLDNDDAARLTLLLMRADHLARTKPAEAEKAFAEVIARYPDAAEAYRALSALLVRLGRVREALQQIEKGLAVGPKNVSLLLARARLLMEASPSLAVASAMQAREEDPGNEEAVMTLAAAHWTARAGDRAVAVLQETLHRPDAARFVRSRQMLAELLTVAGDFKAADTLIAELAGQESTRSAAAALRIRWHQAQKQWDLVSALAADHLSKQPPDLPVVVFAAMRLLESGQPAQVEKGLELLREVTRVRPDMADAWFALGSGLLGLGRFAEARAAYETGLKLEPASAEVLNNLAWLLCEELNEPDAAAERCRQALQAAPNNPHVLDTWGVVLFRQGKAQESADALRRCLDLEITPRGTRSSALFHLARTLEKLSPDESRKIVQSLLTDPEARKLLSPSVLQEAEALQSRLAAAS